MIANLALWFAVHVLFAQARRTGLPEWSSLRFAPALLTSAALVLMFVLKWNLARTLTACAVLGATSVMLR